MMPDSRSGSCSSLLLLDAELDNNSDVFDPPPWRPGRFLQFADLCLEDEPSVRPVSLSTGRNVPSSSSGSSAFSSSTSTSSGHTLEQRLGASPARGTEGEEEEGGSGCRGGLGRSSPWGSPSASRLWGSASSRTSSFVLEWDPSPWSQRHVRLNRRTLLVVTSCVVVALTALTFLTFAIC